jgi:4-hydroxyphenylacetate 3-monooxygenase
MPRGQKAVLYVNHALVNPPIDRGNPAEQVKDVFVSIQKKTDAGSHKLIRLLGLQRHKLRAR